MTLGIHNLALSGVNGGSVSLQTAVLLPAPFHVLQGHVLGYQLNNSRPVSQLASPFTPLRRYWSGAGGTDHSCPKLAGPLHVWRHLAGLNLAPF